LGSNAARRTVSADAIYFHTALDENQLAHLLKNMICRAAIGARIGALGLTFDGKFASAKGPQ
jgi:hypothetical protein